MAVKYVFVTGGVVSGLTARALADSLQYRDKDRLSLIDIAKDV